MFLTPPDTKGSLPSVAKIPMEKFCERRREGGEDELEGTSCSLGESKEWALTMSSPWKSRT